MVNTEQLVWTSTVSKAFMSIRTFVVSKCINAVGRCDLCGEVKVRVHRFYVIRKRKGCPDNFGIELMQRRRKMFLERHCQQLSTTTRHVTFIHMSIAGIGLLIKMDMQHLNKYMEYIYFTWHEKYTWEITLDELDVIILSTVPSDLICGVRDATHWHESL